MRYRHYFPPDLYYSSCLAYIDTRVGTAPSATHTAGRFGRNTEEYGQTLPAVLEPNGMNFRIPQTRDTPSCYAVSLPDEHLFAEISEIFDTFAPGKYF